MELKKLRWGEEGCDRSGIALRRAKRGKRKRSLLVNTLSGKSGALRASFPMFLQSSPITTITALHGWEELNEKG